MKDEQLKSKKYIDRKLNAYLIKLSSLGAVEERPHYDVIAPRGGLERADEVGGGEDLVRLLLAVLVVEQHRRRVQEDLVLAQEVVHAPRRLRKLGCEWTCLFRK